MSSESERLVETIDPPSPWSRHKGKILLTIFIAIMVGIVVAVAVIFSRETPNPVKPIMGVSSSNYYATKAGMEILQQGGNAFDALVAVQAALTVTEPFASGVAGSFLGTYYVAKEKKVVIMDGSNELPSGMVIGTGDSIGGLSVGVPGTLSAIVRTLDEYGTMSLSQVFAPAIRYARYGWEVDEYTSNMIDSYVDVIKLYNKTSEVYLKNGGAKQPGDMVVNPELANTLELIAQRGQAVFYTGEIAVDILNALQTDHIAPGSLITQEDLAGYQAVWRPPVTTECNGYDIWGGLTPGSGGVFMGLACNIFENLPYFDWGTLDAFQGILNTLSVAGTDARFYSGDQDFVDNLPWQGMIDEDYASERSKFINYTKAAIGVPPGQFPGWNVTADYNPFDSMTTHFSIIDKYDNMIACSTTLMGFWGSGIMVRGFLLNNRLSNFPANSTAGITPGRRLRKTALPPWNSTYGARRAANYLLNPTLALKNGFPYLALGTPGSSYIPGNTFTTLLKILYWNMSLTDAILSPRLNSFNDGIWLIEENDVFNNTKLERDFAQVGIAMRYLRGLSAIGDINAVQQYDDGTVDAFADPRRDGYAEVA